MHFFLSANAYFSKLTVWCSSFPTFISKGNGIASFLMNNSIDFLYANNY